MECNVIMIVNQVTKLNTVCVNNEYATNVDTNDDLQ